MTAAPRLGRPADARSKELEAEELLEYVDQAIDLARGLGKRLSVAGLSLGGLLAAWVGLRCANVDLTMATAPDFGLSFMPRDARRLRLFEID